MFEKTVKILIITLVVIVVLLAIAGVIGWWFLNNKISKINYEGIPQEVIQVNEGVELEKKGYRNIAILGVDSRADKYDDSRSDCIIIASINEETNDVKLVSVYRDSLLDIEGYGLDKVTHAYAYGGAGLTLNTLNKNLDLDIKEYIAFNFGAVIDIINEVNGIEITIESDEVKYINDYIDKIDRLEKTETSHLTVPGKQNLNGVQALAYSRVRYTEGGDYKRAERARNVLQATFAKAKTLGLNEQNSMLNKLLPEISTNIKVNEIKQLLPEAIKYNINTSIGWPYEVRGITLDRWYGVPVTLEENVKRLHKEMFEEAEYEPSNTVKEISQAIISKTNYQ